MHAFLHSFIYPFVIKGRIRVRKCCIESQVTDPNRSCNIFSGNQRLFFTVSAARSFYRDSWSSSHFDFLKATLFSLRWGAAIKQTQSYCEEFPSFVLWALELRVHAAVHTSSLSELHYVRLILQLLFSWAAARTCSLHKVSFTEAGHVLSRSTWRERLQMSLLPSPTLTLLGLI